MAIKRNPRSEPMVSSTAAAPARGKTKVTRKHQSAAAAETSENPVVAAESPVINPTFEEIAQLAYCYWEARGYQDGSPEQDWLRAEHELRSAAMVRA